MADVNYADAGGHAAQPVIIVGSTDGSGTKTLGPAVVDTELPAAVALSDTLANPTAPAVAAHLVGWKNAATWVRLPVSGMDAALGATDALRVIAFGYRYGGEGSNHQMESNTAISWMTLASAARTATTYGPDIPAVSHVGALVYLNVTAQPGGAETLSLQIQALNSMTGDYITICDFGVLFTAATGHKVGMLYPGILAADAPSGVVVKSLRLSTNCRVVVSHSGAGSWTYSVHVQRML